MSKCFGLKRVIEIAHHKLQRGRRNHLICSGIGLFMILAMGQVAFATNQEFHLAKINETEYALTCCPLEDYWSEKQNRPTFVNVRSSNWVGYDSEWKIQDNTLWLTSANGNVGGRPFTISDIFGNVGPIAATWFTGTTQLLKGKFGSGVIGREIDVAIVVHLTRLIAAMWERQVERRHAGGLSTLVRSAFELMRDSN